MPEYSTSEKLAKTGKVEAISDGICQISGLPGVGINMIVSFSSGCRGLVIDFSEEYCHTIVIGDFTTIKRGDFVEIANEELTIPAGDILLGRIINPLGEPLDSMGQIKSQSFVGLENEAKSVFEREAIDTQLQTGFLLIDSQIPIGRGQRELLIGEKRIGKEDTTVAIMLNQKLNKTGVVTIYVTIGAQTSFIKRAVEKLNQTKANKNTVFVVGDASDPASLNYLSPLVGMSIAEEFAARGKDVLIIFDNLTRHARIYRQISLLLKRAPGREAYPGDIFYLHSRLLERAGKFSNQVGGGSITALPLVETISDDITDYITTNLMSITDGHILFTKALYHQGRRPAISTELSVSRIGGKAQIKLFRDLSNDLKLIIGQYAELESLTSFGTELQPETLKIIERGRRIFAFLNQEQDYNFNLAEQCFLVYFLLSEELFDWPTEAMDVLRKNFLDFVAISEIAKQLESTLKIEDGSHTSCYNKLIEEFTKRPETVRPINQEKNPAENETVHEVIAKMDQRP